MSYIREKFRNAVYPILVQCQAKLRQGIKVYGYDENVLQAINNMVSDETHQLDTILYDLSKLLKDMRPRWAAWLGWNDLHKYINQLLRRPEFELGLVKNTIILEHQYALSEKERLLLTYEKNLTDLQRKVEWLENGGVEQNVQELKHKLAALEQANEGLRLEYAKLLEEYQSLYQQKQDLERELQRFMLLKIDYERKHVEPVGTVTRLASEVELESMAAREVICDRV